MKSITSTSNAFRKALAFFNKLIYGTIRNANMLVIIYA